MEATGTKGSPLRPRRRDSFDERALGQEEQQHRRQHHQRARRHEQVPRGATRLALEILVLAAKKNKLISVRIGESRNMLNQITVILDLERGCPPHVKIAHVLVQFIS